MGKGTKRAVLLLGVALWLAVPQVHASVLLVSWDGAQYAVVEELLSKGKLPNLSRLLATGQGYAIVFTDQLPEYPTVTKPGHAQMLTGEPWRVTTVKSNREWGVIPEGMSLPEQWKAAGASIGWVVGKRHLSSGSPFHNIWALPPDCTYYKPYSAAMVSAYIAAECLRTWQGKKYFFFWHTAAPDHIGHRYGATSEQYRSSLIVNDQALGVLLDAIEATTQVVVTTDHGFGEGEGCHGGRTHDSCPNIWVIANPPLTREVFRLLDLAPLLRP